MGNLLFDEACAEIQAAGVAFAIPGDLAALNRLAVLAERVDGRGFPDATAALLAPSVRVGNVTLHRLTLGGQSFVSECVIPWFSEDKNPCNLYLGLAYALAHSRVPETHIIPWWGDREGFRKALKKWKRIIGVRWVDLVHALDKFRQDEIAEEIQEEADPSHAPARYGSLIECLCRDYGQTPGHWLWEATLAEIDTLLGARTARAVQEAKARGPVKGEAPDPDRADLTALRLFRQAVQAFKDRKAAS